MESRRNVYRTNDALTHLEPIHGRQKHFATTWLQRKNSRGALMHRSILFDGIPFANARDILACALYSTQEAILSVLGVMAALFAYLDESESMAEECPAVCVAGFLGTGLQSAKFAKEWNAILKLDGIEVFHTCEFETEIGRRGTVYETWQKEKREKFQNDLLAVINRNLFRDVGIGMTRNTYNQVMTGDRPRRYGDIFLFSAKAAMMQATRYSIEHFGVAPSFVVEKGGSYENQLEQAYYALREVSPLAEYFQHTTFSKEPKSDKFPQLQAADYLAFNFSKSISHLLDFDLNPATQARIHEGREIRPLRYPLQQIYRNFGSFCISLIDAQKLEDLLEYINKGIALNEAAST